MTLWGALAGGFVGALAVELGVDAAARLRLSRLDIPTLLGTAVAPRRVLARAVGYLLNAALGLAFAAAYAVLGVAGWGEGAIAGLVHGALAVTVLFPLALPLVHPRMALRGSGDRALVEPPGMLVLAYGRWTPPVLLTLHVFYGAVVGGFAAWSS